ncbi:MAG: putative hydrolase or acyltransferase of alpha/beta superfamily [Hydrocarboniphaga sp.]|uniref:alpha/beta fold hydrolase n=1 Tax=Hydrocarboniphaga sp. TaxID=2033016 RepID=UPI002629F4A5|nr:alpha/beta hydrolase [Hydrocarboniphaga sp.]MDB5970609.1 putative hydrolase or acyltransferase of alpha/beta superfamily [Hydrocarboniphaga sp.]
MTDYVFVHGGGQAGWVWQETIAALHQQTAGKFGRALALDAPGCGEKRGRDTEALDVDAVVTEFVADISASGLKDIVLVGHSQAGTILPRLVEKRPDLFRRLVYVSCIAPMPGQSILQQMGSGLHGSNKDQVGWPFDPKTVDARKRFPLMFCNDMNEAETAAFLAKLGQDTWPAQTMAASDWRYEHLGRVPSTYLVCLRDGILPLAWQETFAARLKTERQVRIDAGHQVMNTRPQALAEALRYEAM